MLPTEKKKRVVDGGALPFQAGDAAGVGGGGEGDVAENKPEEAEGRKRAGSRHLGTETVIWVTEDKMVGVVL